MQGRRVRFLLLAAGPTVFLLILRLTGQGSMPFAARAMSAILGWMALWWLTEVVPLGVTALLPLVLFPLTGVMTGKATATQYINSTIFLFMGGFLLALAMQRWQLHRRIAYLTLALFGRGPYSLLAGFMLCSAVLSMWVSNTATALIMLPVALAVLSSLEGGDQEGRDSFAVALLLGIAYSCSTGGLATVIGSPPNLILRSFLQQKTGLELSFGQWFVMGLPLSILMLSTVFGLLSFLYLRNHEIQIDRRQFKERYSALGAPSFEEKSVFVVFITTALLWVFRKDIVIGAVEIRGWSNLLPYGSHIDDATVAMAAAVILFLLPARRHPPADEETGEKGAPVPEEGQVPAGVHLLEITVFARIPWPVILLFGGGFALAAGFSASGLDRQASSMFESLKGVDLTVWILLTALMVSFITEFTSNTASTQLLLPVLLVIATAVGIAPAWLLFPAAFAASMAFMMPVATPPNAIVFSSGRLRIAQMARTGIMLNIIGALWVLAIVYLLLPVVLNVEL